MSAVSKISAGVDIVALPSTAVIRAIEIALIDVASSHRKPDPDWVEALRQDMTVHGQHTPIHVVEVGDRFRLIKGRRRTLAVEQLGFLHVDAIVQSASDFASEAMLRLREISTQLMRRELNVLDRSVCVSAWRSLYEAANGVIKRGRRGISLKLETNSNEAIFALSEEFAGTFTEASQRALNLSKQAVFRALQIASIDAEVRDRIALHPLADNQSELLALQAEPVERQTAVADMLLGDRAKTVLAALLIIDGRPAEAAAPWVKFSERFTKLKENEQDRFFDTHEAAVSRWQAKRKH